MTSTNVVELRLLAKNGVFLDSINNQTERGQLLNINATIKKLGGVQSGKFTIQNVGVEVSTNIEIQVWRGYEDIGGGDYRLVHQFTGYIDEAPIFTSSDIIDVDFKGYWDKFNNVLISETYTTKTILQVITDIYSKYDFFERFDDSLTEVIPPSITIPTLSFENAKFSDVLKSLVNVANYDYNTTQYTAYLTKDNKLAFKALTLQDNLFEGYQFQDPKIDYLKPMVNKVLMYSRDNADAQKTYYRGSVTDSDSVSKYGTLERSLVFPMEEGNTLLAPTDTNAIVRFAKMLIDKYKENQWRASIKKLTRLYEQGFLTMTTKFGSYKTTVMEGDSLVGWDFSGLINTTYALDTSIFLFGSKSIRFDLTVGSTGEEAIYTFDSIFGVFLFEIYVYLSGTGTCKISVFNDVDFKSVDVSDQNEWLKVQIPITLNVDRTEGNLLQRESEIDVNYTDTIIYDDGTDNGDLLFDDGTDQGTFISQTATEYIYDDGIDNGNLLFDDGTDQGSLEVISTAKVTGNLIYREGAVEGNLYIRESTSGGQLYTINQFKIEMTNDTGKVYLDRASISSYSRLTRTLAIEKQKIKIEKASFINDIVLGEKPDSLIDEVKGEVKQGDTAYEFLKGI